MAGSMMTRIDAPVTQASLRIIHIQKVKLYRKSAQRPYSRAVEQLPIFSIP